MSSYSFSMGFGAYTFATVFRKCPTPRFLNPLDRLARALVMAGTSLHTGALYIGMG
jgi:hypothetical protein